MRRKLISYVLDTRRLFLGRVKFPLQITHLSCSVRLQFQIARLGAFTLPYLFRLHSFFDSTGLFVIPLLAFLWRVARLIYIAFYTVIGILSTMLLVGAVLDPYTRHRVIIPFLLFYLVYLTVI